MRARIYSVIMLLGVAACGPGAVRPASLHTLPSQIPGIVQRSQASTPVPPDQQLTLRISMPLNNPNDLADLLDDMYNPASPRFHQYLTPDMFAAQYHPTAAQAQELRDALQEQGFSAAASPHGTLLEVGGTAAHVEQFFHTHLLNYTAPDGTPFYAPTTELQVPENLPIGSVVGLNSGIPKHSYLAYPNATDNATISPAVLQASGVRQAYNMPATPVGDGQVLALLELDGYALADPTQYAKNNHLPTPPLVNILVDNYDGSAGSGQVEVDTDIELMEALDPNIAQIRVYEGPNAGNGMLDTFNEMANPTLGDKYLPAIISTSWGLAEDQDSSSEVQSENQVFMQMAAQGQTVFAASGDSGADADGQNLGVGDPASQPYVLGVGGTTLNTMNGAYQSETTWSGGGGGISTFWQIPSWQKGMLGAGSKGSTTMRNVPDLSFDADPATGYDVIVQGKVVQIGGTSCAAPLWAAFLALVDQQRAENGLESVGFLAPIIYTMAESSDASKMFHDVADNSTNGFYPAVTGLDDATGWGSFNGTALMEGMSAGYARRPFQAPSWLDPNSP